MVINKPITNNPVSTQPVIQGTNIPVPQNNIPATPVPPMTPVPQEPVMTPVPQQSVVPQTQPSTVKTTVRPVTNKKTTVTPSIAPVTVPEKAPDIENKGTKSTAAPDIERINKPEYQQGIGTLIKDSMTSAAKNGTAIDDNLYNTTISDYLTAHGGQSTPENIQKIKDYVKLDIPGLNSRFAGVDKLSTMSVKDIATSVKSNKITSEDLSMLKIVNPELWSQVNQQILKDNKISAANRRVQIASGNKDTTIADTTTTPTVTSPDIEGKPGTFLNTWNKMVNTSENNKLKEESIKIGGEIAKIQEQQYNLKNEMEKKYPGASKAEIEGMMYDINEGLNSELRTKMIEKQTIDTNLAAKLETAKGMYEAYSKDVESASSAASTKFDQRYKTQVLGLQKSEAMKPYVIGTDDYGSNIYGYTDPVTGQMKQVNLTGNTLDYTTGSVTNFGFRNGKTTDYGIDYDGQIGDLIPAPKAGVITKVSKQSDGNVQVQMTAEDGNIITFNHLDESSLGMFKEGQQINVGDAVGVLGNTGYVVPGKGGDGSHVDIRIRRPVTTGNEKDAYITGKAAQEYLGESSSISGINKTTTANKTYDTLSYDLQNIVDQVGSYDMDLASAFSARGIKGQALKNKVISALQEKYPRYSQSILKTVIPEYQSQLNTKVGGQVSAFNTAIRHAGELAHAFEKLENGDIQAINTIRNKYKSLLGDADIPGFDVASLALGEEFVKAFKGGQPDVATNEERAKVLNKKLGPDQFKNMIKSSLQLLADKTRTYQDSFYARTGLYPGDVQSVGNLIQDDNIATLAKRGIDTSKYNLSANNKSNDGVDDETLDVYLQMIGLQ